VSRSCTHATYFRAVSRHYTPEGCKQKELELKHHRVSRNRRALRNVLMASSVAAVLAAGGSIRARSPRADKVRRKPRSPLNADRRNRRLAPRSARAARRACKAAIGAADPGRTVYRAFDGRQTLVRGFRHRLGVRRPAHRQRRAYTSRRHDGCASYAAIRHASNHHVVSSPMVAPPLSAPPGGIALPHILIRSMFCFDCGKLTRHRPYTERLPCSPPNGTAHIEWMYQPIGLMGSLDEDQRRRLGFEYRCRAASTDARDRPRAQGDGAYTGGYCQIGQPYRALPL
jgi:hypothetical protein